METIEQLLEWFTRKDILRLQEYGWYIHEYQSDDYWWYPRFAHYVVRQSSLRNEKVIKL